MISDPTIIPLTLVLLVLVTIAVFQNLYKIAGFLVFTYCLYIFILWIRIEPVVEKKYVDIEVSQQNQIINSKMDSSSEMDVIFNADSIEQSTEKTSPIISVFRPLFVNEIFMSESIVNRTPIRPNTEFSDSLGSIYCFTTIENLNASPQVITHKWWYENQYFSEIDIEVGRSYNWRCWSKISNLSDWPGSWKVFVSDTAGSQLDSISFVVKKVDSVGLRRVQ